MQETEALKFFTTQFAISMSCHMLPAIVKHEIAEKLLSGPLSLSELCSSTSINPDRLHRYLLTLQLSGLFSYDPASNRWSNTDKSVFLTKPLIRNLALVFCSEVFVKKYMHFDEALTSNQSCNEILGLPHFFVELTQHPETFGQFQSLMGAMTNFNKEEIVKKMDLSSTSKLLDIAGGDANLCIALAEKYEDKRFAVMERPEIVEFALQRISRHGLEGRVGAICGNALEEVAEGFDGIMMKHFLHSSHDAEAEVFLTNCRKALKPGNRLFLIEFMMDGDRDYLSHYHFMDQLMMLFFASRERSLEQYTRLLEKTGFRVEGTAFAHFDSIIQAIAV
jgi:ubiquinone/menaquinone biosynthesis C-methylase UbiE